MGTEKKGKRSWALIATTGTFLLTLLGNACAPTFRLNSSAITDPQNSFADLSSVGTPMDARIGISVVNANYSSVVGQANEIPDSAAKAVQMGFQYMEFYADPEICGHDSSGAPLYIAALNESCAATSLSQMIQSSYFQKLFTLPIPTIALTTSPMNSSAASQWTLTGGNGNVNYGSADQIPAGKSVGSFRETALALVTSEYYGLAKTLLQTQQNTNKTYVILSNNEMDWQVLANKTGSDAYPDAFAIQNAIDYWNAAQAGFDQARADYPAVGVTVKHACEVNLVWRSLQDSTLPADQQASHLSVTKDVVPQTHCDLYGYSAYDSALNGTSDTTRFQRALSYLKTQAHGQPVFISEVGVPEVDPSGTYAIPMDSTSPDAKSAFIENLIQTALSLDVQYFVYWALYDNSCVADSTQISGFKCNGQWILKPDGTESVGYQTLQNHLSN